MNYFQSNTEQCHEFFVRFVGIVVICPCGTEPENRDTPIRSTEPDFILSGALI